MSEPRILIISHGHPDFSLGGAEIAAHTHWTELRRRGIEATLVSRVSTPPGTSERTFTARSADSFEVFFSPGPTDPFRHSQQRRSIVFQEFRGLLESIKPTVIHFHHYVDMGLELIREARKYGPAVPIVMTLHEYHAICHARGQMLKTNGRLCRQSAPLDCSLCFPGISPQDFFLRETFIKSFLSLVDRFVSPSHFLRDRYIAWGLPAAKIVMIENGQPRLNEAIAEEPPDPAYATRFVVVGQLSHLKGTLVLLDAVRLLPEILRKQVRIEIHGSTDHAEAGFKIQLEKALEGLEDTVGLRGPYMPAEVGGIIRRNGWVIVPSIWWENSPLVIQEAFTARRPVICSNIGGMREKVTHGVSGLHFCVADAGDLAARIEECATGPELWKTLCAGVPHPPTIDQTVDQLLELYSGVSSPKNQPVLTAH